MKEILKIKSFCGIADIELKINKINLFIGTQASGKSIIAKLSYFFKNFTELLFVSAIEDFTKTKFDKRVLQKFESYFPPHTWGENKFELYFLQGDFSIEIIRNTDKNRLELSYSEFYKKALTHYGQEFKKNKTQNTQTIFSSINYNPSLFLHDNYKALLKKEVGRYSVFNQLFIPAGRAFFASHQSSFFSLLSLNKTMDPFWVEFSSVYERLKEQETSSSKEEQGKNILLADKLISEILIGKYHHDQKSDYIIHQDNRKVNVTYSSSGQQEILPLVIILKELLKPDLSNGSTLYIEEPEAHLFPQSQKTITELIINTLNSREDSFQLFLTTHSPYILSSINNLIEANNIAKELPKAQMNNLTEIVPEELFVNYEDVSAYSVEEGKLKSILDDEVCLISENILDEVSDKISTQYGNLLNLR